MAGSADRKISLEAHRVSAVAATQSVVISRALPSLSVSVDRAAPRAFRVASELNFDSVYDQHAGFVYRSLCRLGVPSAHVADATQDVFVVVHRKLASFENRSSVRTWLFGIALRVAKDWTRRERRRPSEPLPHSLTDERRDAPFEGAVRSEAVSTLYKLLDELTPDQRAIFVLVELEEMNVPEAAAATGANVHTATSRLKAARQRFEAALRRHRNSGGRSEP